LSLKKKFNIFRRPATDLNPLDAYALWANNYPPEAHNSLMKIEEQAMLDLLPELKNKIVLDLACGSGRYILKAKEQGASAVYGLDFSLPMLSHARNVSDQLVLGNMTALPLVSDSFDVVICGLSIGHVPDLLPVYGEISRILSPNGVMVCSDIHPFGKLAGWERQFTASNGRQYSVEHHFQLYESHHAACTSNQLTIETVREPLIKGRHQWEGMPAILAIRARKSLN
jgi:malonyl-CoA O-methyltransferase